MRRILVSVFFISLSFISFAQTDTTLVLDEIIVRGFETRKANIKTPASISSIGFNEIQKYNGANPLPILNAQTGIRMEERSPGSYRLALRGSSIRSQFGVRNVKVYWNGIPMSDANGTTYFNLTDFNSLGNIEILKGPASSIFGAGYGGVISLNTMKAQTGSKLSTSFIAGSYNMIGNHSNYQFANDRVSLTAATTIHHADGYRDHSGLSGNKVTLSFGYKLNDHHNINYATFYSAVNYNTPGGLTLAQMEKDRRASRPATPATPGSYEQRAAIIQQYNLHGVTHHWFINPTTSLSTGIFGSLSHLENPFISNYEDRHETNFGYRILGEKDLGKLSLQLGSEAIHTDSDFDVMDNNGGIKGAQQYFTNLLSTQFNHFAQVQYSLPWGFDLHAGISYNQQKYINETIAKSLITKVSDRPYVPWTPRIAILKDINRQLSFYYSWSSGYSTPTAQEITANYENASHIHLAAEEGISHEIGIKANWNSHFKTDLAIYDQDVKRALIRNVLENGGEFFENTGNIIQKGLELGNEISFKNPNSAFVNAVFHANLTLNDFTFGKYVNEGKDLSGKTLPGTSKTNFYLDGMLVHQTGVYLNFDLNYLSKMPLNSVNEVYADGTTFSSLRLGWTNDFSSKIDLKAYVGADNILNKEYSVGYDFNAFGNRFYNPAPTRNYNLGINISLYL